MENTSKNIEKEFRDNVMQWKWNKNKDYKKNPKFKISKIVTMKSY